MTTRLETIAKLWGVLCIGGVASCDKGDAPATEVPSAENRGATTKPDGRCLHSEGCCGGHTRGDGSCGASKAETDGERRDGVAAQRRFEWTVAPGGFAEINLELDDDAQVTATFDCDAPVAWNIHSHIGDDAKIHAEGTDATGTPSLKVDQGGLYSYLWANQGQQPVRLTVELRFVGQGRVHSTHP